MTQLWASFVVFILPILSVYSVEFHKNEYHIVVAINENVQENMDILTEVQNAMTSASKYLHQTTRNYTYIQKVTILVPETWTNRSEWTVSDLTFKKADIRVDTPHPAMGDNPYTFQPGLCGEEGRYIHLTPDFVLDNGINRDLKYGDFGRLLVHEFAHLRYGVFDEYGDRMSTQHPVYYLDEDSTLRPTACSTEFEGTFVDMKTNKLCTLEGDVKLLTDSCDFNVSSVNNKATSSVMFAQFLDEVVHFCETKTTDPKLQHNADAPNKHNKMCNGRGTWDIIKEHKDIKYGSHETVHDTTPTFQIVQRQIQKVNETEVCGRRFVFVLDVSGSMRGDYRYFKLRQMADKIIRDILPVGTEVGIVVFSSDALVWADMRYLKTEADRQMLADGLPTISDFGGETAIGYGLLNGTMLLEKYSQTAEEGRLFLITDGQENVEPYVSTILGNITNKGVVVHTLAYSDYAADVLQELSRETRGQYSYYDENDSSTTLDGAAQRLLEDVSVCGSEEDDIEIDRHSAVLNMTAPSHERTVLIDSTVGNNTLFVFTLSLKATTKVSITDPSGIVYDEDSSNYKIDTSLNIIRFRFAVTEAGKWIYSLQKGQLSEESVVGVVKSHPRDSKTLPFKMESWLGKTTYNIDTDQEGLAVYSYVHQGYAPVLMAEVKVIVSSSTTRTEKVLLDNGKLPDTTAEDGVYTNYVVGFRSNSRHFLEVRVNSIEGQTVVMKSGNLLTERAPTIYPNQINEVIYVKVEPFNRITSVGAVDIKGLDETLDQLPPSRVTDLEAIITDRDRKEVTLTWTAPGDDLNEGMVTRYDIRVATAFEDLRGNFFDCHEILATDIIGGSDTPVPAGSQQNMTVSLPGHLNTDRFVFGLKAIDDSGRTSELSNLKAATFEEVILPRTTTTTSSSTPFKESSGSKHFVVHIIGLIVSTSIAGVLVVLVISTIICLLYFKGRGSQISKRKVLPLPY